MGVNTIELDGQKAIVTLPGWAKDKVWGAEDDVSEANLAKAYTAGVWAYICITIRADLLAKVLWEVRTDFEDPDTALGQEHPLVKLLKEVNPELNWGDLARATESDLGIFGTAYWLKVRGGRGGAPAGLQRLNPMTISLEADASGIQGFKQQLPQQKPTIFPREEVVYFREYHPMNDLGGLSKMSVALSDVNAGVNASEFTAAFFKNYAMPPVLISPAEGTIKDSILDRFVAEWKRRFRSESKQHKVGFMTRGVKADIIGYPMKDLALKEVLDEVRRNTCGIFRVPPAVAGAWEAANYAASKEQMKALYENALEPRTEYLSGVLEAELLAEFDTTFRMAWRFDKLAVMQEGEKEEAERHAILVHARIEDPEAAAEALDVVPYIPEEVPPQLQDFQPVQGAPNSQNVNGNLPQQELMQWERFATRRAKLGHEIAQPFRADTIKPGLHAAIMGQLEEAKTRQDVKEIFKNVTVWGDYPGNNVPPIREDEMDKEALKELKGMREDLRSLATAQNNEFNDLIKAFLVSQMTRGDSLGLSISADKVVTKVESPAPEVTVENKVEVSVPEQPAPVVNVEATKPTKQAAPVVEVTVPVPEVNVEVDLPGKIKEHKKVNRNRQGFIESIDGETTLED